MITKNDMDNILKDVNRVFGNYEERLNEVVARLKVLEDEKGKSSSTTSSKTSQAKS